MKAFIFKKGYCIYKNYPYVYTIPGVLEITCDYNPFYGDDGDPVEVELTKRMEDLYKNRSFNNYIDETIGCKSVSYYDKSLYVIQGRSIFVMQSKNKLLDWLEGFNLDHVFQLEVILEKYKDVANFRVKEKK